MAHEVIPAGRSLIFVVLISCFWSASLTLGQPPLQPPTFEITLDKPISATRTCGVRGPSGDATTDTLCPVGDGQACFNCTGSQYPIGNTVDSNPNTWWVSPPLGGEAKDQNVDITIDLCQEYEVSDVTIQTGPSPLPGVWVLERSEDFGLSFSPWQYYVPTASDCRHQFGVENSGSDNPATDSSVLCLTRAHVRATDERALARISLTANRPGATQPGLGPLTLRNWKRATNIRLRFWEVARTGEDGDSGDSSGDSSGVSSPKSNFYTIDRIAVRGHCNCHGYARQCVASTDADGTAAAAAAAGSTCASKHTCQCMLNTCGARCETCCPGYQQVAWRANDRDQSFSCEACQCFGHSESCTYNSTIDALSLSLNALGRLSGGGVCNDCLNNTAGVNCELCRPGFYRPRGASQYAACIACNCDEVGSTSQECAYGVCSCKASTQGKRCDQCKQGHYSLDGGSERCLDCGCDAKLTIAGTTHCNEHTGQCLCREYLRGKDCAVCAVGTYPNPGDRAGCSACDCSPVTSQGSDCSPTGQCVCHAGFTGRTCNHVSPGYFLPSPHAARTEAEDGGAAVKRHSLSEFPGFSGEGYVALTNEAEAGLRVENPYAGNLYIVVRYLTRAFLGRLQISIVNSHGVTQQGELLTAPTNSPVYGTFGIASTAIAFNFPEAGFINITMYGLDLLAGEEILVDYLTVVPQGLSAADQLISDIPDYCAQDTPENKFCQRRALSDAHDALRWTTFVGPMPLTPGSSFTTRNIASPGGKEVVFVVDYLTPSSSGSSESPGTLNLTVFQGSTPVSAPGVLRLEACPYEFSCRQVLSVEGVASPASVPTGSGDLMSVEVHMWGSDMSQVALVLPPRIMEASDWSPEFMRLSMNCIRHEGRCHPPLNPPFVASSVTIPLLDASTTIPDATGISRPLSFGTYDEDYAIVTGAGAVVTFPPLAASQEANYSVIILAKLTRTELTSGQLVFTTNVTIGSTTTMFTIPYCPSSGGCLVGNDRVSFPITSRMTSVTITPTSPGSVLIKSLTIVDEQAMANQQLAFSVPKFDQSEDYNRLCIGDGYLSKSSPEWCSERALSHAASVFGEPQACNCHAHGSRYAENCTEIGGQCACLDNFSGLRCDRCMQGYFGFPACEPCNCADGRDCDRVTGQCPCPVNTQSRTCGECVPATRSANITLGCEDCNCSKSGSLLDDCDMSSGVCLCKPGFDGQRCDRCADEFHSYPACGTCSCSPAGSVDNVCSKTTAECECKVNVNGMLCDTCSDGFFNLMTNADGCTDCGCDAEGTVEGTVCNNVTGQCACKSNVTGVQCDACAVNTYRLETGECGPCMCSELGSRTLQCDVDTAHCTCKSNVAGDHCDRCALGNWNFDSGSGCQACNCTGRWSVDGSCDPMTGQCSCKPSVVGQFCQACKPRHVPNGDLGCVECDECTDPLFDEITVMRALLLESNNDSSYFDSLAAARIQLDNMTAAADRNDERKSILEKFVITAYGMLGYDVSQERKDAATDASLGLSGSGSAPLGSGSAPPGSVSTLPGSVSTPPGSGSAPLGSGSAPPGSVSTLPSSVSTPPGSGSAPLGSGMEHGSGGQEGTFVSVLLQGLNPLASTSLIQELADLVNSVSGLQSAVEETNDAKSAVTSRAVLLSQNTNRVIERIYFIMSTLQRTANRHRFNLALARRVLDDIQSNGEWIAERQDNITAALAIVELLKDVAIQEQEGNHVITVNLTNHIPRTQSLDVLIERLRDATEFTRNITRNARKGLDRAGDTHDLSSEMIINATSQLESILVDLPGLVDTFEEALIIVANTTDAVDTDIPDAISGLRLATQQLNSILQRHHNFSAFVRADISSIVQNLVTPFNQDLDEAQRLFAAVKDAGNRSAMAATAYRDITTLIGSALRNASDAVEAAREALNLARNQTLQGIPGKASRANGELLRLEGLLVELQLQFNNSRSQFANISGLFEQLQDLYDATKGTEATALERENELADQDPAGLMLPAHGRTENLNGTITGNGNSLRAVEEAISDSVKLGEKIKMDIESTDKNHNHVNDVVGGLDTARTVNMTREANENIVNLKGRAKAIFGRLAGVQDKIARARQRLDAFPGAIKLSASAQESGSAAELSLNARLSESYKSYTIVRFSVNPSPIAGSQLADGVLFYLGPILPESSRKRRQEPQQQQDWLNSIRVFATDGVLGATVRGGYAHEASTVEFSLITPTGTPFLLRTGQWHQIIITRFGNWDIRAEVRIPTTPPGSTYMTATEQLRSVANEKFNLRQSRFFIGGVLSNVVSRLPEASGVPVHSLPGCYNEVSINDQVMGIWSSAAVAFSTGKDVTEHACQSCASNGADQCRRSRVGSSAPATMTTNGNSYISYKDLLVPGRRNVFKTRFRTPSENGVLLSICGETKNDSIVVFLEGGVLNIQITKNNEIVLLDQKTLVDTSTNVHLHYSDDSEYSLQFSGPQFVRRRNSHVYVISATRGTTAPSSTVYYGTLNLTTMTSDVFLGGVPLTTPQTCRPSSPIGGFSGCLSVPELNNNILGLSRDQPIPASRKYSGISFDRCSSGLDAFRPCAQLDGEFRDEGGRESTAFLLFRRLSEPSGFLAYFSTRARISFSFQTSLPSTNLLFATRDGGQISSGQIDAFMHISLQSGGLLLEMTGVDTRGIERYKGESSTTGYNDGKVHQILLTHDLITGDGEEYAHLKVFVDYALVIETKLRGLRRNWIAAVSSFLSLGGLPRSIGGRVRITEQISMKGCVCNLVINDKVFNLAKASQRNSLLSFTSCKVGVIPRMVPAPPPTKTVVATTLPPNCPAFTAPYTESCWRFSPSSRLEYNIPTRGLLRSQFSVSFRFRTRQANTILFYLSSRDGLRFASIAVQNDRVSARLDSSNRVMEDEEAIVAEPGVSYSDGQWHKVRLQRQASTYVLIVNDNAELKQVGTTLKATIPLNGEAYFGALPEDTVKNRLGGLGLQRFVGAIDNVVFTAQESEVDVLLPERLIVNSNVSKGCYESMAELPMRMAHGYPQVPGEAAYTQLNNLEGFNISNTSADWRVQLELSTRQGSGTLFYWGASGTTRLVLSLNDGQAELMISAGTSSFSVRHPLAICSGKFYNVDIRVSNKQLELTVGEVNGQSSVAQEDWEVSGVITMGATAFVGHADPSLADAGAFAPFNGCVRGVIHIGGTDFSPLSSDTTEAVNVNPNNCHVLE